MSGHRPTPEETEYVTPREFYGEMTKLKVGLALNTAAVVWAISGHPAPGAVAGAIQAVFSFYR